MLEHIAKATTGTVVINREDPRLAKLGATLKNVSYFGLDANLLATFPNDDELHGSDAPKAKQPHADVVLQSIDDNATFIIDGQPVSTSLQLKGVYNIFNAAAALALTRTVVGTQLDQEKLIKGLSAVTPAFGRGEQLVVDGQPCELVLVKNPSGFRLSLHSFNPKDHATMIVINDNYADGRDMSWLWDVDFASLKHAGVSEVSGVRAYDMALRLQYDEVAVSHVDTDITRSLKNFLAAQNGKPKRIYCTYTAMLALRRELGKITSVQEIS